MNMMLIMMTLPYLLLEDFCNKALSVGDVFVCGFFFLKIFTKRCAILIKLSNK